MNKNKQPRRAKPPLDYNYTANICYKVFLPFSIITEVEAEVAALGRDVLADEVFDWITDAEHNKPYIKGSGRDAFGRLQTELVTGEGWRELQKFGLSRG
jgi:hypothetical protein